ncbi:hypothetical protein DFH08DRAFT_977892 [Mycena albidolilacea]|uniref:Uncharacterized protein n=1 Tax=Mycena albidolilacea TaxID=1033008 RepID=A0AAD6Z0T5_9AGAR|nr:hypothetical protein DFH08DRAFT_977892 [Mycena albidolilacea]
MEDAFVVDHFRVSDLVTRHATGPQDESDHTDAESECDLSESDDDDYIDEPLLPPKPAPPPASSHPTPSKPRHSDPRQTGCSHRILQVTREQWEPKTLEDKPNVPQSTAPAPGARLTRKEQKAARHRAARAAKQEVLCETAGCSKAPKAVSLARASQSSPTHVEFRVDSHQGVASSGWMGLLHPETDLEPEACEYSFEEAQAISGMRVLDWQGKPGPLVDADAYVFGVFSGQPRDPDWQKNVAEPAAKLMDEAASNMYDRVFHGVYYGTRKQEKKQRAAAGMSTLISGTATGIPGYY